MLYAELILRTRECFLAAVGGQIRPHVGLLGEVSLTTCEGVPTLHYRGLNREGLHFECSIALEGDEHNSEGFRFALVDHDYKLLVNRNTSVRDIAGEFIRLFELKREPPPQKTN